MQISLVMKTARSATFLLDDGGRYHTKKEYKILLNNKEIKTTDTVVTSVFDLKPDTDYEIKVTHAEEVVAAAEFTTDYEYVTLDVKKFGAKGDGISDDTGFIQAAIMACPPKSRVLIPKGVYRITSIFLKSGLNLEIAKGAELKRQTVTVLQNFRDSLKVMMRWRNITLEHGREIHFRCSQELSQGSA